MSLKINIIYKGIIYRVKGIKVLCSVVFAVIILLAAIVGMGAWMIFSVYDDRGETSIPNNSSSLSSKNDTEVPNDTAPSIDFGKSILPSEVSYFVPRFDDVLPKEKPNNYSDTRLSLGVESELYGSAFYNTRRKRPKYDTEFFSQTDRVDKIIPSKRINGDDLRVLDYRLHSQESLGSDMDGISEGQEILSRDSNSDILSSDSDYSYFYDLKYPLIKSDSPKKINSKSQNQNQQDYDSVDTLNTQFYQRKGVSSDETYTYDGPPVVGYGSNPYEKLTQERIREYDYFWQTYTGKKLEPQAAIVKKPLKPNMRPHLRGLRPTGEEYDLPIRPDAQVPSKIKITEIPSSSRKPYSPNRSLMVGDRGQPPIDSGSMKTTERPTLPIKSPLQELYDYSKKLAASLLSFNSKSAEEIKDSSQKLAEYGIHLIESHNHVFKQPKGSPLHRIVSLIPSAEKLKSLDAFELSLVTWTFLDFWEFLIEKVGTLSDQDLVLLQERLEKLRKRKDDTMTRVLVNETLTRYGSGYKRSMQKNRSDSEQLPTDENVGGTDEEITSPSSTTTTTLSNGPILDGLFPSIETINSGNQSELTENKTSQDKDNKQRTFRNTVRKIINLLTLKRPNKHINDQVSSTDIEEGRSAWDPLGLFNSDSRMQFMQFAVKVLFNFGKVYLKKSYALDCSMLLFCKDLNQDTKKGGMESMAAKLKSVGLKVLTESDQQLRESDTFGEVWRSVTAWTPLQCDVMFPRCDGPKALEIVNEVAMGSN